MENKEVLVTDKNDTTLPEVGGDHLTHPPLSGNESMAEPVVAGDNISNGDNASQGEEGKKERKVRDYSTRKPKSVDDRAKRLLSIMKVVVKIKREQDENPEISEEDKFFTTAQILTTLNAPYRNWGKGGKVKEGSYSADISTGIKTLGFVNVGKGKSTGRGRNPFLYKLVPEQLSLKGKILYLSATKELKIEPFKFSDEVMAEIEKKISDDKKSKERAQSKKNKTVTE